MVRHILDVIGIGFLRRHSVLANKPSNYLLSFACWFRISGSGWLGAASGFTWGGTCAGLSGSGGRRSLRWRYAWSLDGAGGGALLFLRTLRRLPAARAITRSTLALN